MWFSWPLPMTAQLEKEAGLSWVVARPSKSSMAVTVMALQERGREGHGESDQGSWRLGFDHGCTRPLVAAQAGPGRARGASESRPNSREAASQQRWHSNLVPHFMARAGERVFRSVPLLPAATVTGMPCRGTFGGRYADEQGVKARRGQALMRRRSQAEEVGPPWQGHAQGNASDSHREQHSTARHTASHHSFHPPTQ